VTLVIDAAPLVALADRQEPRRDAIVDVLRAERGSLFIPAAVTSEIDYLLDQRFGPPARRAFLEDLAAGRYESPALDSTEYGIALDLDRRYADLNLGLADLSVIVLAQARDPAHPDLLTSGTFGPSGRSRGTPSLYCPPISDRGCRDRWA
jgi:predicted nucleic acid-binding protein